jgi:DNA-binding NarL/FixJ family response regulator
MSRIRVYIVDDNTLFLVAASRFLADFCGAEVIGVAQSGQEALRRIVELRPDVVLLDYNMPGMSGLEAAARIKNEKNSPAVVIVSLNASAEMRERAMLAGCDGFVSKIEFTAEIPPLIEVLAARQRGALGADDQAACRCNGD